MREQDPEMAELAENENRIEAECHEVAEQLRRTRPDSPERGEIKNRLAELVNKHFEVRQARRKVELKRLEEHLKRLRQSIEQREAGRESLVNRRIAELVGEKEDVGF
jgi:branched-subunit amino acid aminotransferase/4-amino-4-deoxychorismate lyase